MKGGLAIPLYVGDIGGFLEDKSSVLDLYYFVDANSLW